MIVNFNDGMEIANVESGIRWWLYYKIVVMQANSSDYEWESDGF